MADDSQLPILLVAGLVIFILQTAAYLILVEKIGQIGASYSLVNTHFVYHLE